MACQPSIQTRTNTETMILDVDTKLCLSFDPVWEIDD